MSANPRTRQGHKGLLVIHAGLFRTGTASITAAYRRLGYRVHHGTDDKFGNPYKQLEQAAEATWPTLAELPGYTYKPPPGIDTSSGPVPRPRFTQDDWNEAFKGYDIATDMASPFALELIEAYPDAKVVVVERDFETWWPSFKARVIDTLYNDWTPALDWVAYILGSRAMICMRKIHAGFFDCPDFSKTSIEARSRETHREYYRRIREAVPLESGRRLDFKLSDGWEPLCIFLGKTVPEGDFPTLNDSAAHERENIKHHRRIVRAVAVKVAPLIAVGVSLGIWITMSSKSRA